jgi:hypothetical protein
MSLSNLLVLNSYNTESNSHQLNVVAANPIVSTHDLWANSAFTPPHVFWGAVDLQAVTPAVTADNTLFFPAYTSIYADNIAANNWLMQKDANGTLVMQLTGLAAAANLFCDPVSRHSINVGTGYELTGFDVVYCNVTAMTSATVTLNSIQYTNNVANSIVNVPVTGAINIAASATNVTPWVTHFNVTTPFFLAQDQTLDLKIAITSPLGNVTNVYGIFSYFTNIA